MIHWCLSVLALKVEKSFDDGGLRLTDKSWMPPPRCFPSLILLSYVCHCYCYGNPLLFYFIFAMKVQAEGRERRLESRLPSLLVCLARLPLSPIGCFSVSVRSSSHTIHFLQLDSASLSIVFLLFSISAFYEFLQHRAPFIRLPIQVVG